MPSTITYALPGHAMRVLLDGVDYSCRLDGATVMLNNQPVEVSNFSSAMKDQLVGTPEATLQITGQIDTGTRYGTQAMFNRRLAHGQAVNFVIQPAGHLQGGLTMAGTALILRVETHVNVADVLTVQLEAVATGHIWMCRTLIPFPTKITAAVVGNALAQGDRNVLLPPHNGTPYVGSAYFQIRNEQHLARTFGIWSSATPFAQGTAPTGSQHFVITLLPGQLAAGAIGTPDAPSTFQRYMAIVAHNSIAGEVDYGYLALVDEEISLITAQAGPVFLTGPEPETPALWDDNFVIDWDDSNDVIVAGWP